MSLVVGGSSDIQQVYALGHNIMAVYLGRQIVWPFLPNDLFVSVPGPHEITLVPGTYRVTCRGGGGQGGRNNPSGRKGGAGGYGHIAYNVFNTYTPKASVIYVGGTGDNGGVIEGYANTAAAGGAGGLPSYINIDNSEWYYALGGGGGGGAGGQGSSGRYSGGGAGGSGGGYYHFIDGIVESIAGKKGGPGGCAYSGAYHVPQSGVAGNTAEFPTITSAGGSGGAGQGGTASAAGGGASGGGGGGGANHSGSPSGAGGGGAGGDLDAGGGQGGSGGYGAGNGSNFHKIGTDTTAENAQYGVFGNYGKGGDSNTDGVSGFVWLRRIGGPEPQIHVHLESPTDVTVVMTYQGWKEILADINNTNFNPVTYIASKYGYQGKIVSLTPQLYELDDGELQPITLDGIIDCEDVNGFVPDSVTASEICGDVTSEATESLVMGPETEESTEDVAMGILGTGGGSIVTEIVDCGGFETVLETINLGVANG